MSFEFIYSEDSDYKVTITFDRTHLDGVHRNFKKFLVACGYDDAQIIDSIKYVYNLTDSKDEI